MSRILWLKYKPSIANNSYPVAIATNNGNVIGEDMLQQVIPSTELPSMFSSLNQRPFGLPLKESHYEIF